MLKYKQFFQKNCHHKKKKVFDFLFLPSILFFGCSKQKNSLLTGFARDIKKKSLQAQSVHIIMGL